MTRLQLDHNVSLKLPPLLEAAGHDVIAVRDVGLARATDDALLLSSVRTDRIFLTHNRRDFRLLHDAWITWPAAFGLTLPAHPGILILDASPSGILVGAVSSFLASIPPARLANAIFWWHRRDGWRKAAVDDRWEPHQLSREEE